MRKLWSTFDICVYYDVTKGIARRWRADGLKCTMLSGSYYYDYKDIIDYLMED